MEWQNTVLHTQFYKVILLNKYNTIQYNNVDVYYGK